MINECRLKFRGLEKQCFAGDRQLTIVRLHKHAKNVQVRSEFLSAVYGYLSIEKFRTACLKCNFDAKNEDRQKF